MAILYIGSFMGWGISGDIIGVIVGLAGVGSLIGGIGAFIGWGISKVSL